MAQKHQIYGNLPLEFSVKPVALQIVNAIGAFLKKYTPKKRNRLEVRSYNFKKPITFIAI